LLGRWDPCPVPILWPLPIHKPPVPGGSRTTECCSMHFPERAEDFILLGGRVQNGQVRVSCRWRQRAVPLLRRGHLCRYSMPSRAGVRVQAETNGAILLGSTVQGGDARLQGRWCAQRVQVLCHATLRGYSLSRTCGPANQCLHVAAPRGATRVLLLGSHLRDGQAWLLGRWLACRVQILWLWSVQRGGLPRDHYNFKAI
jgi:hypothetical protein